MKWSKLEDASYIDITLDVLALTKDSTGRDEVMRVKRKPVMIGVPVVMVTALLAVLALWAWGPLGTSGDVQSSNATLVWNVEYWHRNAAGEVLQHKIDHNAVTPLGKDAANVRLIGPQLLVNLSENLDIDTYDQIVLANVDLADGTPLGTGDVLLEVDGGTGNNAGQDTDAVHTNPADGAFAAGATGVGTVTNQFLAQSGISGSALEMRLVKTLPDDTAAGGAVAIPLSDTLAIIGINVTLADTDTLTITWTITIS